MEAQSHGVDQGGLPWYAHTVRVDSQPLRKQEYKYSSAAFTIPESYRKEIERNIFQERPIMALLNSKMKKAKEELATNLERQLFGEAEMADNVYAESYLKGIISDAYDKAVPKEKAMRYDKAVEDAMSKRKEARANVVLDFLDAHWGEPEPGETHTWEVHFDTTPDKTYHYAAVLGDNGRWYVTHNSDMYTTEELKAFIADIALRSEMYFNGELVA